MGVRERELPGSANGAAPEGSIQCATNPEEHGCTSCAFLNSSDPSYATECPVDPPSGSGAYLDPEDDQLNVRFFHMKQRFGLDAQYPVSRYVTGLQGPMVSDSANEHDAQGNYLPALNCVNPLFATGLPTGGTTGAAPLRADARAASTEPGVLHHDRRGAASASSVESHQSG